jgi:PEP-CTERM motif
MKSEIRNGVVAAAFSVLGMAGAASANQISVHLGGSGSPAVTNSAGVSPQATFWNLASDNGSADSFSNLIDNTNTGTGVGLTVSAPGFQNNTNGAQPWMSGDTGDTQLWTGSVGLSSSNGAGTNTQLTIALSNIPAPYQATGYYVYFYLSGGDTTSVAGGNGNGGPWYMTDGTITDNGLKTSGTPNGLQTYYFNNGSSFNFTGYSEATATTAGAATPANYVGFLETAGSVTFTVPMPSEVDGNAAVVPGGISGFSIRGFQIVQVPEPATIGLFGAVGAAALMRRRRRAMV